MAEPETTPDNRPAADYPRPDLEPKTEEEILERKNPLGYTITEPTEEEIEEDEAAAEADRDDASQPLVTPG